MKSVNALKIMLLCSGLVLASCDSHHYLEGKPIPPKDEQKVKGKAYNPKVDILFVIDDSGSMMAHQNRLSTNITLFTNEIFKSKVLDFHIGVVTTSTDSWGAGKPGGLYGSPKYIDRNTPNGVQSLANNLLVGTNGSGIEMLFDPVFLALTDPNLSGINAGFYRPDAYLAIIFITDAEDQSTKMKSAQDFYNFLLTLKSGNKEKILAYGAFIPSSERNCERDDMAMPRRIENFYALTSGTFYSLCDPQYGTHLAGLGANIIMKTGRYMYLDRIPKIETIRVTYGSQVVPEDPEDGWSFDPSRNAVVLGDQIKWSIQPAGTSVEISFEPLLEE